MKKILSLALCLCMIVAVIPFAAAAPDDVNEPEYYSYVDIVNMMTDMERLSVLPEVGEKSAEFTSYQRTSTYNATADTYSNWGANGDSGGYISSGNTFGRGTCRLAVDIEGAGVIWRFWCATAGTGNVEIFIDDDVNGTTPTFTRRGVDFFDGTNEANAPFNYDGLCYTVAQGKNSYVPITFSKACKIYLYTSPSWGSYYHFNYSLFPEGTTVEPMPATMGDAEKAALSKANAWYKGELGENPNDLTGGTTQAGDFTIDAGSSKTILNYDGQGAIAEFKLKLEDNLSGQELYDAVKALTVSMYWDGETSPSVWAPLGDFFGAPFGVDYTTLPMGVRSDGWYYCYLYMPFATNAKVVISNDGSKAYDVALDATIVSLKGNIDDYARFHAKWHRGGYVEREDRWPDYYVLQTEGRGRFLGFMLHAYENGPYGWWGEGDEKFFVDGEKFPSSFGTGTEDYFGYAWCDPTVFNNKALHAQPHNEGGIGYAGSKVNLRFQTVDSIPFQTAFEGTVEKYLPNNKTYDVSILKPYAEEADEYSVMPYWYLESGGVDNYKAVSLEDRTNYYAAPDYSDSRIKAQTLSVSVTGGSTSELEERNVGRASSTAGVNILWPNTMNSGEISFDFKLGSDVDSFIKVRSCYGPDCGIYQFYLDGEPIGDPVDFYYWENMATYYIPLKKVQLKAGLHTLSARPVGKNENSSNYYFGLDCLSFSKDRGPRFFNGVDLKFVNLLNTAASYTNKPGIFMQDMTDFTLGTWGPAGEQAWWTYGAQNDELTLEIDLKVDIADEIMTINYGGAGDYGIFQLYIDGDPVGTPTDTYVRSGVSNHLVEFGPVTLSAGKHELKFVAVGRSGSGYLFGLDYIRFDKVEEPKNYSYVDIVNMMTNMERLSLLPESGEVGAEWTTYDRRSRYDAENDAYINWSANSDGGGGGSSYWPSGNYLGRGTCRLAADLKGAGVIWRIWTATANAGTIEIVIDGDTENPIVQRPFNQLFDGTDEANAPFNYDGLCYVAAQGKNCFVPITFNESCQIYLYTSPSWGNYFEANYTIFSEGTTVQPMPRTMGDAEKTALSKANEWYKSELGENPNDLTGGSNFAGDLIIDAGSSKTVLNCDGQGAIAELRLKLNDNLSYEEIYNAVQELTMSMYWDGEMSPSVWAPLGDFFGAPFGDEYTTLPMGVKDDGWYYCYFYMPFATSAKVVIGNDGSRAYDVSMDATVVPLKGNIDDYARFHAKWNRGGYVENADRQPDYYVLQTEGMGRFLGFMLHVFEKGSYGWWGEGDEKFFVDGEKFPSYFGTGSEDYFGYAWCDPAIFNNRPLHAQPHNEGGEGDRGNKVNLRFQTVDNVPFQTSFEGCIEKYLDDSKAEYGVMPYWYLAPGGTDKYEVVSLADRTSFFDTPDYNGEYKMEAESMNFSVADGSAKATVQGLVGTSGGAHVKWLNDTESGAITFTFTIKSAVNGVFKIRSAYGPDYGIYQLSVDGVDIGKPIDFYNISTTNCPYIPMGKMQLDAGKHTLSARPVGKNQASSGYAFSLDCIAVTIANSNPKCFEGEDMKLFGVTGGSISLQGMSTFTNGYWSSSQVWWANGQAGDYLALGFTLEEDVVDEILTINYTKAGDYGIFQLYIDGVPTGSPQDCYNNGVISYLAGFPVTLAAGEHELKFVLTGRNSRSTGNMVGIDFVRIDKYEVLPKSIVNGYAANVKIVSDITDTDATVTLFGQTLPINGDPALLRFVVEDIPEAGVYYPEFRIYNRVVTIEPAPQLALTVVPRDDNIWVVNVNPGLTGTELGFNADIAPKSGTNFIVEVNGSVKTCKREGNSLIIPYVVQVDDQVVIRNVKYPELFPSYSFTFTITYNKPE